MTQNKNSSQQPSLPDVLAEMEMRFLSNLPEAELTDAVRVFMQVEQAHWFYEDFFVDNYKHLKTMKLPVFAKALFEQSIVLSSVANQCDNFYMKFKHYRHQIPVCGAIMLNSRCDKMLLVRSWQGKSWTFPRGKINEGEEETLCAAREVYEETGFMPEIDAAIHHRLEVNDNGKRVTLYVVPGVDDQQHFEPLARKEVSKIEWFSLNALPKGHFNVAPFMGRLKKIASMLRKQNKMANKKSMQVCTSNKKQCKNISPNSRSQTENHNATKGGKKHKKPSRSHFGTEETRDFDQNNQDTFENALGGGVRGGASKKGWGIEEMFAANSRLTGLQYTYDGNAQTFGDQDCKAVRIGQDNQKSLWRAEGNQHVTADSEDLHSNSPRSTATTFSPSVAALFASADCNLTPLSLAPHPPQPTPAQPAMNPAVAALFAAAAAQPPAAPAPASAPTPVPQSCGASAMQWKGGLLMPMTASK